MGLFMALKTTLEQIEEVQAAITEVMTSQSLSHSGGTVSRANLAELQAREEKLLARYRIEQGTGGPTVNIGTMRRE
jgi:hypothetical protein